MSQEFALSTSDIFMYAKKAAFRSIRFGEDICHIPAFSDALYGYAKAVDKISKSPTHQGTNPMGLIGLCMRNQVIDGGRSQTRYLKKFTIGLEDHDPSEEEREAEFIIGEQLEVILSRKNPWKPNDIKILGWLMDVYGGMTHREVAEKEGLTTSQVKGKCRRLFLQLQDIARQIDSEQSRRVG